MTRLFVLLAILSGNTAYAEEHCEVVGKAGAMVYVYCPAQMTIESVTTVVKSYSELHFDQQRNQVHIDVFNDKKATPKDVKQLMKMSDASVEKHHIANYSNNRNTGYLSYMCKKTVHSKLADCKDLVK